MSKAKKFIQNYARNCSNECWDAEGSYHPWLSIDEAKKAVEIAREEVMDEVCDYIKNNLYKHLYVYDGQAGFPTHQFINDLKQAMKDS